MFLPTRSLRLFPRPCLLALVLCLQVAAQRAPVTPLTLDRLYRLPSVIGTRPEQPQWSPDSRHLAFLWNDEGMPFLDVWLADVSGTPPMRLTHLPHPGAPADPGTDVEKLEAQAKFETDHGIEDLAWTGDGKRLVFTLHGELYGVAPGAEAVRLAPNVTGITAIVPRPRSNDVAVLAAGALWTVGMDGSAARAVYSARGMPWDLPGDLQVEEAHWSPDGTQLAFVEADLTGMPVRGIPDYLAPETTLTRVRRPYPGEPSERRRLGVVSATGSGLHWLGLPGGPMDLIFGVTWAPDGGSLLVDRSDLYIKHRRLLQVDAATGRTVTLVAEDDARNVTAEWWSTWAAAGKGVYYTSDQPPATDYAVWYKPLGTAPARPMLAGNFAVFAADVRGDAVFATVNPDRPEQRQVVRMLPGSAAQPVTSTAGTHTVVPSPDGKFLADLFSSDTTPPDLYLQATSAGAMPVQLTHSPLPEFATYRWVAATHVTFANVHDGVVVHARLTLPPDFDRSRQYPAVLGSVYSNTARNQWGGRVFHPTWGLDQVLAQQGYVLLNPDIRGSSGYGRGFRQRLALDYGGIDVDDLYSGARYLAATGFVDPRRVGIWGSSYGGLLTTTALFTHPETFRAGVAGAPATSLFHALTGEMRTMMDPQTHVAAYTASSAFLKSGGLQGHLMLLQGMRDNVVLFKDSVTLTERLILQGKDVTLTPLPDAPHGWDTEGLAQTRYAYRRLVDYFNRWLGPVPPARTP